MVSIVFDSQYSTSPEGKNAMNAVNMSGMNCRTRACTGSGGAGLSFVCQNIAAPMSNGSTK